MKRIQVTNHNPVVFLHDVLDRAKEGYEIDPESEFSMFFNLFTVGMFKRVSGEEHDSVFLDLENIIPTQKKKPGRPSTKEVIANEH